MAQPAAIFRRPEHLQPEPSEPLLLRTSFDFSDKFEDIVLSAILYSDGFYEKFHPLIKEEMFRNSNRAFIIALVVSYFGRYGAVPSPEILCELVERSDYKNVGEAIRLVGSVPKTQDTDYVADRILLWARWSTIENVWSSHQSYDSDPKELASQMQEASRIGDELDMAHTHLSDEDGPDDKLEIVGTPWRWLNEQLRGGVLVGDLAVVLTVIGGGKTTTLVNLTRSAIEQGKFVVFFTFEDGDIKIKRRLTQTITNMTLEELLVLHPRHVSRMRSKFLERTGGRCDIKNFMSRRSTVEDAASFVQTLQDASGRKVDVVITDYADRFKPHGRYSEPRHALREIFEDCKWMARSLGVVHWTARQVNKTRVGKEIISIEHAGEAFGTMESPDVVIGMGQSLEDERIGRISLFTAKLRDSKDHMVRSLVADFPRQRISDVTEVR